MRTDGMAVMALLSSLMEPIFMTIIMIDGKYDDHHVNVNGAAENFGMRVSREQMAENRRRILDAASRLFREKGFDAVSVAEVMKAAGLTHGGFYGHFGSKDDLVAQTLAHVLAGDAGGGGDLRTYLDAYLSPRHRDNAADGCPTAGLAADIRHQTPAARSAMTEGLRSQIDRISEALPGQMRQTTPRGDRKLGGDGGGSDPRSGDRRPGAFG